MIPKPLGILQSSGKKNVYRNSVDYTEIQAYRSVVDPPSAFRLYHSCFAFCYFCCAKATFRDRANLDPWD